MDKKIYKRNEIESILFNMLYDKFGEFDFKLKLNSDFSDELDSLDSVELIMEIESVFGIHVNDNDAENMFKNKKMSISNIKNALEDYRIFDVTVLRKDKLIEINKKIKNEEKA